MADLPQPTPVREVHAIDRARFEAEIVPAYRPVLFRGLVADWPLVREQPAPAALAAALSALDNGRPVETFVGKPAIGGRFFYSDDYSGYNFDKRQIPLGATLTKLVELQANAAPIAVYAGSAPIDAHMPDFARSHVNPLVPDGVPARIWIGNAVSIAPHFDMSRNIACVLAGRRRFTFFPPDAVADLYVGPLDRTIAGPPASVVDLDRPDLDRFPRFARALERAEVAELTPGDAVYVPPMWWHGVRSFDPVNVLVNYWWGEQKEEGSPFTAMVHAMMAVRDLPETERRTWRAFFDTFVFGEPAEMGEHLPSAARGVLGPRSPERTRAIRGYLKSILGR